MNYLKSLSLLFAAAAMFSFAYTSSPHLMNDGSKIVWKGKKVLGAHEGTINLKDGNLEYVDGILKGGAFTIDMTTIECTDLEGAYGDKLVGHLKSDDFFGVEKFPTADFTITRVDAANNENEYKIEGNLTIKGITKKISFKTMVTKEGGHMIAHSNIKVDRTMFNVKYGSSKFFDNLGDNIISDEFELDVTIVSH